MPKRMGMTVIENGVEATVPAIYELDGDTLRFCQGRLGDREPPTGFDVKKANTENPQAFPTCWNLRRARSPRPTNESSSQKSTAEQSDFKGPYLQVGTHAPANGGMLENPEVRQIGERFFIVGQLVSSSDRRAGMTFWFPLEDIWMMTEYPDKERAISAPTRPDAPDSN